MNWRKIEMDSNDLVEPRDNADQADQADAGTEVDLPSATIIGANIAGVNTAPFPGGIVAPAADLAAEEAAAETDLGALDLDALEQFGSKPSKTGDEGVSPEQSELEAGELNG
jgi:hypothetical protein